MSKKIILVTGATGAQGGSVAEELIRKDIFKVRCLTRNARSPKATALEKAGAEIMEGDLNDEDSLAAALKDCYGVFGVTNFWEHFGGEFQQGLNLINAVKKTGIEHFVFSTLPDYKKISGGEFVVPHCDLKAELEDYSRSLGLKATYVHVAFYYENFITFFPPQKREDGSFHFGFPQGNTKLAAVSVEDLGGIVAPIFEDPIPFVNKVVGAVGDDRTCSEYAAVFTKVLGQKVVYDFIPRDVFKTFGFPGAEELADMFAFQEKYINNRGEHLAESKRLNPGVRSFDEWLIQNKQHFEFMIQP